MKKRDSSLMNDHQSVSLEEVLECFSGMSLRLFIDGTLGAGGHAAAILDHHPECSPLIGFDQDPVARDIALKQLEKHSGRVKIVADNFRHLDQHLNALSIDRVDGILLDFGASSMQLNRS